MCQRLCVEPFSASNLHEVQGFHCGDDPWEREVSDWIKGAADAEESALRDMGCRGTLVWLYKDESESVVGVGSLGKTRWRWPYPSGQWQEVGIIPFVGLDARFHGEPRGAPREERFAYQVMGDLIYKAKQASLESGILGLFVDARNRRAIRFYEKIGFEVLSSEDEYLKMFLDIR